MGHEDVEELLLVGEVFVLSFIACSYNAVQLERKGMRITRSLQGFLDPHSLEGHRSSTPCSLGYFKPELLLLLGKSLSDHLCRRGEKRPTIVVLPFQTDDSGTSFPLHQDEMPFSQDGSRKSGHPMRIIVVVVNRPGSSIEIPGARDQEGENC